MSIFCRLGHCNQLFFKKGDFVKKGQKICTIGDGNRQYKNASHLHVDFPKSVMPQWTAYVFSMTRDMVKKAYADPKPFRKISFPEYDHMGWGYLDYAKYGTRYCYHPGEDWNGKGAGNSDFGDPIYSPFDGEVVYCYDGTGTNGGWGKLIVIKEIVKEVEIEPVSVPKPEVAPDVSSDPKQPTAPIVVSPATPQSVPVDNSQPIMQEDGQITTPEPDLGVIQKWVDRFIDWLANKLNFK